MRQTDFGGRAGWPRGDQKVLRVHGAVAYELVGGSMNLVGPRFRDGVDHSSRGLAIFSGEIASQNGKLTNGVHTEIAGEKTAGGGVKGVIEAYAVDSIVVLRRARSRNGQNDAPTTRRAIGGVGGRLCMDRVHARLKLRQVGPGAPIQGQFAHDRPGNDCADFRGRRFDDDRTGANLYLLGCLSDLQRDVDCQLRSDSQIDAFDHGSRKSSRFGGYLVWAGQQVRHRIETCVIRGSRGHYARCRIGDGYLHVRDGCRSRVSHSALNISSGDLRGQARHDA